MSDWVCIKDMELSNSVIWKVWNTCGKNAFVHWVFCKKQKQPKLWWNSFFFFFLKTRSKKPINSGAYHHLDYMDYMKNLFR